MSDQPRLRVDMAGAIGRITLACPEQRNALDDQAARELRHLLEEFEADPDVRAVIIKGDGDHFSAHTDSAAAGSAADEDAPDAWVLGRVFLAIRQMTKPVVAAVQGQALGSGAALALACDMVIARDDARFAFPEVRQGRVPSMVLAMLRRAVGEKHAFDLVASGRMVTATDAERMGLVSRVIPASAFDGETERIILGLSSHPTGAMARTKQLFYELDAKGFRESLDQGALTDASHEDAE